MIVPNPQAVARDPLRPAVEAPRAFKADHVYATLREAILSGALPPGAPIDKPALCQRLAVSRFPVSAAVNRLAFEKLVLIAPQHGSFVSPLSLRDVREHMLLRRAIEGDLAAEAARQGTATLDMALSANLAEQARAAEAANHDLFFAFDIAFHDLIVRSLALPHAAEVLDRLSTHLERVRRLLTQPVGRTHRTFEAHQAIAMAIAARDADAARSAMRAHLDQTSVLFEDFARDNPSLFAKADHA